MSVVRKHRFRHTRDVSHISNHWLRLPNVGDIKAYRSAFRGIQYDPYERHRVLPRRFNEDRSAFRGIQYDPYERHRRFVLPRRFNDSSKSLADPLAASSFSSYAPLFTSPSEGFSDSRYFSFRPRVSGELSKRHSLVRFPVEVRSKRRQAFVSPPSVSVVPSGKRAEYLSFNVPAQVAVCLRRKQRREVIFALGHGGGRHKPPKWNDDSFVRC